MSSCYLKTLLCFFLLIFLYSCEEQSLCQNNNDCRGSRICLDGICQYQDDTSYDSQQNEFGGDELVYVEPEEFCSGQSKFQRGELSINPLATTSYVTLMNCCEPFSIVFHTEHLISCNLVLDVMVMGLEYPPERLEIDSLADNSSLGLHCDYCANAEHGGLCELIDGSLSGWIEFKEGEPGESRGVSACLEVAHDGEYDGVRLFANDVPVAGYNDFRRFEIFLLQDETLTTEDVENLPLNSLELGISPILDLVGISYYDRRSHELALAPFTYGNFQYYLPDMTVSGIPFVVVVDGEKIFLGSFASVYSSVIAEVPMIYLDDYELMILELEWFGEGEDPRDNQVILDLLRETGKLVE